MIRELIQTISQLFVWLIVVAPWEQALRIRGGKTVALLKGGMHFRIPFIDRIYRQPIRRRLSVIPPQTITTLDGKAVSLSGSLGYEIIDLLQLYQTLHDAQDTLEAEVSAAVASYICTHTLEECQPTKIEECVRLCLDISKYGLSKPEFFILNFASVRTYRLIQGELKGWRYAEALNTCNEYRANGTSLCG